MHTLLDTNERERGAGVRGVLGTTNSNRGKIELITTGIPDVFLHLQDTGKKRREKEVRCGRTKCNIRYVRQNGSRRSERRKGRCYCEPAAQHGNVFPPLKLGLLSAHQPSLSANTLYQHSYKGGWMTHFHTQRDKSGVILWK